MKKVFISVIFVIGLIVISPLLLYWYGLSYINENLVASSVRLNEELEVNIWIAEKEIGDPRVKAVTPYGYIVFFFCNVNTGLNSPECLGMYPGLRTSTLAIRNQVHRQVKGRGNFVWQLSWISSTIWVTRNWDIHQILATYNESKT